MTWMAWRLQRSIFLLFTTIAVISIGLLVANGLHTQSLLQQWNGPPCHGGDGFAAKYQTYCPNLFHQYAQSTTFDRYYVMAGTGLLGVFGLLLGIHFVAKEVDHKTARVAWTQSVTRTQWFRSKLVVSLASLAVLGAPLCLTESWWITASHYGGDRVIPTTFVYGGWLPFSVGVFAFAMATISGTVFRHAGAAGALSLVAVVAILWTMQGEVSSALVPLHSTTVGVKVLTKGDVTSDMPTHLAPATSWIVFSGYVPLHWGDTLPTWGQETPWLESVNRCPTNAAGSGAVATCARKLGLHNVELYVSNNEYWTLQLREGGIYLASAALLLGSSVALLRRTNA